MRKMLIGNFIGLLALLAAFGQKAPLCDDFTVACGQQRLDRSEAEMKIVYTRLLSDAGDPANQKALKKAQESWLKYRDDQCLYEAGENDGGTYYSATLLFCQAEETAARTKKLQELAGVQ